MERRITTRRGLVRRGISVVVVTVLVAAPSRGLDLVVTAAQVNQQIQLGNTTLIAGRPTFVRVTVGTGDQMVPGVDAVLHVAADGVPLPGSPLASINGPILARVSPSLLDEDDTVNFFFLPPLSGNVDLVLEVNPPGPGRLLETDYSNNFFPIGDRNFQCRKTPELIYVPVDYRPGGGPNENVPDPELIDSNLGAAFVRGIYPTPDWNYHEWPMPPVLWTQDINNSNGQFLNFLSMTRTITVPGLGFPIADFIYGWLPGNPFGGNGQANGIPGDAAFGNTQLIRYQRTCAHELGHLLGMVHTSASIATVGVDVEHHLIAPLSNIGRIKPPSLLTIMVGGQLTQQAWINTLEYEFSAAQTVLFCGAAAGPTPDRLMHLTGIRDNRTGTLTLNPVFEVSRQQPTADMNDADLVIEAFGPASLSEPLIHRVALNTRSAADRCDAPNERYATAPFSALIPAAAPGGGVPVDRIVVRDARDGHVLAQRRRSPHTPAAALAPSLFGTRIDRPTRIRWNTADPDGDAVTSALLYSHNGGNSWFVLDLFLTENHYDLDPSRIAGSRPGEGRLRLIASDGMNTSTAEIGHLTFAGSHPPHVEIIFPNDGDAFVALSPILLHGTTWDFEDLVLDDADLVWSSDVDGELAHGRILQYDRLTVGEHTLTLTATDSNGLVASDAVTVQILDRSAEQGDCNDNGTGDHDDILSGVSGDCNNNLIPDECDIADNTMHDVNDNMTPDECEGLGDLDADGDRDLSDFASFLDCVTGPDGTVAPGCGPADLDQDQDVDFADYGAFARLFSGDCSVTITQQPVIALACSGGTASFEVGATGQDLRYQWLFNGQPLPGETDAQLVLESVTPALAGTYAALVFNFCAVEASVSADLVVALPPTFDVQPADVVTCPGEQVSFSVEASGVGALTYQWQHNGTDIPGATSATLVIPAPTNADLGFYQCLVTDTCPSSALSAEGQLEFFPAVTFTLQPIGGEVCIGGTIFLIASADGALSYQWFKDDVVIPGATSFLLGIPNATQADSGVYTVSATGECDAALSEPAVIDVVPCGDSR